MKTIADEHLSLLRLVFGWKGLDRLSLAVFCGFSLTEPGRLYPEAEMWNLAAAALGRGQVLDLCMPKPRGEALVPGKCFAPAGRPVQALRAGFRVGPLEKTLQVIGDRHIKLGRKPSAPTEPEPFTEMDLTWDRAFGGPEYKENPYGRGLETIRDEQGDEILPLPNILPPGQVIASPKDRPKPAGMAPQGLDWQIRLRNRGTHDHDWLMNRWPGLPDDFDFNFFNLADRDQRLDDFFKGDESIQIKNMHPDLPEIISKLPGLRCRLFVRCLEDDREVFTEVKTALDTVYLIPHQNLGLLIWHGTVGVGDDEAGDVQNILAFTESLKQEPAPDEYYYQKLKEPEKETRAAEPVETPEPDEPAKIEPPAPPEIPAAAPAAVAPIDQLDREIDENEQKLREYLREHGVDPDSIKEQHTPDPEPSPKKPVEQVLEDLDREIEETEEKLEQFLKEHGIQPDRLTPPKPPEMEPIGNAAELEDYFRARGVDDPKLIEPVLQLFKEAETGEAELENALEAVKLKAPELPADQAPALPEVEAEQPPPWPGRPLTREIVLQGYTDKKSFSGLELTGLDLSGCDLSGIDLTKAVLENTDFSGASLTRADLSHSILTKANLTGTNLGQALLVEVNATGATAAKADFSGANLSNSDFNSADLSGAILSQADLTGAVFEKAAMPGVQAEKTRAAKAVFAEADLQDSKWTGADLTKADLTLTLLKGSDFSKINAPDVRMHGAQAPGVSFRQSNLHRSRAALQADFQNAGFTGADLTDACWEDSNLSGADLSQTNLEQAHIKRCRIKAADLTAAQARGASFAKSDLSETKMTRIDLMGGSLRKTRLTKTDLRLANLYGVDLYKSVMGETNLDKANIKHTLITVLGKKHD